MEVAGLAAAVGSLAIAETGDVDTARAIDSVNKSYESLEKDLKRLVFEKTSQEVRSLLQDRTVWTRRDVLKILEPDGGTKTVKGPLSRDPRELERFVRALESCDNFYQTFVFRGTTPSQTSTIHYVDLVWAAISALLMVEKNAKTNVTNLTSHLIRVAPIFEEATHLARQFQKPNKHLMGIERCFVDSLTYLLKYFSRVSFKFIKNFEEPQSQFVSEMDDHLNRLKADADREAMRSLQTQVNIQQQQSQKMIADQLMSVLEQHRLQANDLNSLLELERLHARDPQITPAASTRTKSKVVVQKDPLYLVYETVPLIETFEHFRGFLSEEASHVSNKLLDQPQVIDWMMSETSSILCIEGYQTGEPLNWTSEFSLDVIHAAHERNYAVLNYFCGLLGVISEELHKDQKGDMAATVILKALLCSAHSRCSNHMQFRAGFKKKHLDIRSVANLDDDETRDLFEKCLGAFNPGTILYIVIDSIDILENWVGGKTSIKELMRVLSTAADKEHVVAKILFTSSSPGKPTGVRELWAEVEKLKDHESTSDDAAAAPGASNLEGTEISTRISGDNIPEVQIGAAPIAVATVSTQAGATTTKPKLRHHYLLHTKQTKTTSTQANARLNLHSLIKPHIHEPSRTKRKTKRRTSDSEESSDSDGDSTSPSPRKPTPKMQKSRKKKAQEESSESDSNSTSPPARKQKSKTQKSQKKKKAQEESDESDSNSASPSRPNRKSKTRKSRRKQKPRDESSDSDSSSDSAATSSLSSVGRLQAKLKATRRRKLRAAEAKEKWLGRSKSGRKRSTSESESESSEE
ncbi:hypothetical protein BDV95DRAFT_603899 [Massariosphaeria phaeospora]|uniref:Fungal STAND N-terminal Goodbye domain-containing protein n=1 Tax=Massariosphaeria phaeospora TaxID=100035 RepID=A0A7C8IFM5_9PLEO|nr:hypothetical protein BDV95DRAFT_603899 [Massariosphaeria phaeospora]